MRSLFAAAALVLVAAACGVTGEIDTGPAPAPTSPVTTSPVTTSADTSPVTTSPVTTSPVELDLPAPLEGWATTTVTIDGRELVVAIADDGDKRPQGLMFVTEMRDLDGMLFVWTEEREGTFWMENTLIPLDIAWFDGTGAYVGGTTMTPCVEDTCERYSPGVPYQFAVETPAGDLAFVDASSRLAVAG